jgi:hypothetical protein
VLGGDLRQASGVELGLGCGGAERQLEQPVEDGHGLVAQAELVDEVGAQPLGGQLGRVVGGDPGGPAHQLAEHPEGRRLVTVVAGVLEHQGTARRGVGGEGGREPRLADPALTRHHEGVAGAPTRARPRRAQHILLRLAPDQRARPTLADAVDPGALGDDLVQGHHRAAGDHRLDRRELEGVADQPPHGLADHERVRARRLLQLGGDVRRVAEGDRHQLAVDRREQDLPGVGGHAHGEVLTDGALHLVGEVAEHGEQVEAGADGTHGVVVVRGRVAEPHEDAVALVLGDEPAVAPDDRLDGLVVRPHRGEVRLEVLTAGEARRADDIAEHDGEVAPLLATAHGVPRGLHLVLPAPDRRSH